MFRNILFFDNLTDALTATWTTFVVQGLILILLGVVVYFVPYLLVTLVSASLIALGIGLLVLGLRTRNVKRYYREWRNEYWQPFN